MQHWTQTVDDGWIVYQLDASKCRVIAPRRSLQTCKLS